MSIPGRKTAMISSTAADLPDHRKQAIEACLRQSVFPDGMEHLPAQDATGIKASLDMVDRADIYIGIYAHRYGWIPTDETVALAEKELNTKLARGISITEMEFNRALERRIPILIFIISDDFPVSLKVIETGDLPQAKLAAFKRRATGENRIREQFTSPEDLRGKIIHALGALEKETSSNEKSAPQFHPLNIIPQPPEPYIAHPYSLLQTKNVIGRQTELNLLTDWITKNQTVSLDTRIFNLVAIGGMGKSALTWKWFNDIAPNELPHLAGRMWWSFYESDAYFENFIIRALAYTSARPEEEIRKLNPLDRENQLLHLLDTEPFLLVLDGLERILIAYARLDADQMLDDDLDEKTKNFLPPNASAPPPGSARVSRAAVGVPPTESAHTTASASPSAPNHPSSQSPTASPLPESAADSFYGKHQLRRTADHRAGQFLRRLTRIKQSRVLITTRLYPTELQADTGDPLPGCHAQFLRGLTDADALNLWRAFNVTGSTDQLLPLFRSFDNYPLLIRALAGEIANYRPAPRDFDRWRAANPDFNPAARSHLRDTDRKTHVLEHALRGLDDAQRKVLHTIAAFRMPATWDTLRALLVQDSGGTRYTASQTSPKDTPPLKPSDGIIGAPNNPPTPNPQSLTTPKPCPSDQSLDLILTELEDRGLLGWDKKSNRYDLHPIIRRTVWQSIDRTGQVRLLESVKMFFESVPKAGIAEWENVSVWEDLTPAIELFYALIGLKRYDDACAVYVRHISNFSLYRLGTTRQQAQLLEQFFSHVFTVPPPLTTVRAQTFVLSSLAQAYQLSGRPAAALPLFKICAQLHEASDPEPLDFSFANLAEVSFKLASLRVAEIYARHATVHSRNTGHLEVVGIEILGLILSARSVKKSSKTAFLRARKIWQVQAIDDRTRLGGKQGEGFVSAMLAQRSLWQRTPIQAMSHAKAAWQCAQSLKLERDIVRAARLQGESALATGALDRAVHKLTFALHRARLIDLFDEELPTLSALAELHRRKNEHSTARELLDQVWDPAESGPFPLLQTDALNVLTQIERDQNNTQAAIAAATRAYTLAWCDGPPYAYHYGLTNARKHLQELGTPIPKLPPFDPSKFEPLPDIDLNPKDQFWVNPATLDSLD